LSAYPSPFASAGRQWRKERGGRGTRGGSGKVRCQLQRKFGGAASNMIRVLNQTNETHPMHPPRFLSLKAVSAYPSPLAPGGGGGGSEGRCRGWVGWGRFVISLGGTKPKPNHPFAFLHSPASREASWGTGCMTTGADRMLCFASVASAAATDVSCLRVTTRGARWWPGRTPRRSSSFTRTRSRGVASIPEGGGQKPSRTKIDGGSVMYDEHGNARVKYILPNTRCARMVLDFGCARVAFRGGLLLFWTSEAQSAAS